MGSIRHKLPLLLPGFFHRLHHPPGQKHRNGQKNPQAQGGEHHTGPGQIHEDGFFNGHVRKNQGLAQRGPHPEIAQVVFRHRTGLSAALLHRRQKVGQKRAVRQVKVAVHHRGDLPVGPHLDHKVGQPDLGAVDADAPGLEGVRRHGFHHGNALLLQVGLGKAVQQAENAPEGHADQHHNDTDKPPPQFFQHPSFTSNWYPSRRKDWMVTLEPMLESFFRRKPM